MEGSAWHGRLSFGRPAYLPAITSSFVGAGSAAIRCTERIDTPRAARCGEVGLGPSSPPDSFIEDSDEGVVHHSRRAAALRTACSTASAAASASLRMSDSQTRRTAHPSRSSAAVTRASRATFRLIFAVQYAAL